MLEICVLLWNSSVFEGILSARFNGEENKPGDPSEQKCKRDAMARFCAEVGDYLRDFCNSPTNQTDKTKPKGELVSETAQTVPKVLVNPSDAGLLLLDTVRW